MPNSNSPAAERLLIDYFYLPPTPTRPRRRKCQFRLEQIPGGFRVCAGDPDADLPQLLDIRAAYEVRRGNAFKKYDPADFQLRDASFALDPQGAEVKERKDNRLLVEVREPGFRLAVTGLDVQRDLRVEIQVKDKEVEDAADV